MRKMIRGSWILAALLWCLPFGMTATLPEADPVEGRLDSIENRVDGLSGELGNVEDKIQNRASQGLVLFLFGVVAALWAQNTGRGPWLWFFLGVFFNFITMIVLLSKNAQARRRHHAGTP